MTPTITIKRGGFCESAIDLLRVAVLDIYIAGADPNDPLEVELEVERYIQNTLEEGVGYIVKLYDADKVVGLALPRKISPVIRKMFKDHVGDECHQLGIIYVDENYRGYKLSKMIVEYCKSQFQQLLWQCCTTNTPSMKLALSSGFERVVISTSSKVEYTGYIWNSEDTK